MNFWLVETNLLDMLIAVIVLLSWLKWVPTTLVKGTTGQIKMFKQSKTIFCQSMLGKD